MCPGFDIAATLRTVWLLLVAVTLRTPLIAVASTIQEFRRVVVIATWLDVTALSASLLKAMAPIPVV